MYGFNPRMEFRNGFDTFGGVTREAARNAIKQYVAQGIVYSINPYSRYGP